LKSFAVTSSTALALCIGVPSGSFAQPAQQAQPQPPAASSQQPPLGTTVSEDPNNPQPPATSAQPAPTSEQPAPTTAQPAPTAEQPAPTTVQPAPQTEQPAPQSEQAAPQTAQPAPEPQTSPAAVGTSGAAAPSATGTSGSMQTPEATSATPTPRSNRNRLPGTASPLPLMIFASLAAFGLAGLTRALRTSRT
jgi:cytoskeletal protein RodZ